MKTFLTSRPFLVPALFLLPVLAALGWVAGPGFGGLSAIVALFVVTMAVIVGCAIGSGKWGQDLCALTAMAAFGFAVLGLFLVPQVHTSMVAVSVDEKLTNIETRMGRAPALAATVRPWLKDRDLAMQNRAVLNEIFRSETSADAVIGHVVAARTLGVDATFVADNGMVRDRDKRKLFQAAIEGARAGDATATAWLQANPVASR